MKNPDYRPEYEFAQDRTGYTVRYGYLARTKSEFEKLQETKLCHVMDGFRSRKNLVDVKWGWHMDTDDDTKIIGTCGMYTCTALGAVVETPRERRRFVSHMYANSHNIGREMDAFDAFLAETRNINKIDVAISSTCSFTRRNWARRDTEMQILGRLQSAVGRGVRVPLYRSFTFEIDPRGTVVADEKFAPSIIKL